VLAPRYAGRVNGGYTRIVKAGIRASDAAPIADHRVSSTATSAKGQDSGPVPHKGRLCGVPLRPRSGRLPAPPFCRLGGGAKTVPAPFRGLSMLRLGASSTLNIFPLSPVLLALWTLLV
jgi:hypothetical protein